MESEQRRGTRVPGFNRGFGWATRLAVVASLMLAGWTGCGSRQPPTTKAEYEDALEVGVRRAGDKLLISTQLGPPGQGFYESRQIFVSTGGEPVLITQGEGQLGAIPGGSASVSKVGKEDASAAKEVIVKYQVFEGDSKKAPLAFEGEKRVPVEP